MAVKKILLATMATGLITLVGCGGGGGSSRSGTGELTIGLTDGPVEAAASVVVAFTGLELKPKGGAPLDPIVFNDESCDDFNAATGTCSIDLLDLVGEERRVVFNGEIPAGEYNWIRLMVDADQDEMDSYIEFEGGSMCPLWIPSGNETGLKVVSGITVTANGQSDYTLDFDVKSSITAPPGLSGMGTEECTQNQNYILKPAVRIVDTTETGSIIGTVPTTLLEAAGSELGCAVDGSSGLYEDVAVYVFEDFEDSAVADDIDTETDDGNANPITTASVVYDGVGDYSYEVGYLLTGDYLVALTCTPALDQAETNEFDPGAAEPVDFGFVAERSVTVETNGTDGSFPPPAP